MVTTQKSIAILQLLFYAMTTIIFETCCSSSQYLASDMLAWICIVTEFTVISAHVIESGQFYVHMGTQSDGQIYAILIHPHAAFIDLATSDLLLSHHWHFVVKLQ
jgi:hypothetical protein